MIKNLTLFYFITMLISSCSEKKQEVDLIVKNAKVYTVNNNLDLAESFAIKDGKFVAIGYSNEIEEKYQSVQIIDMGGKPVYPGFYDAHCHFYGFGMDLQQANLTGTKSFEEIVERVKDHSLRNPSEWIFGRGWDQNDWVLTEFPTNEILDIAFPNNPVILTRIDGHAVIANSGALKRAKLNIDSRIEGGKLLVKNGKLTGVLIDNAIGLIMQAVPKNDEASNIKALMEAQKECFSVGLTTVDDAGLSKEIVLLMDELNRSGKLKMRVYAMLEPSEENLEYFVKKGPYKTKHLNICSIKLYADGALGSRGAAMIEDYSDDSGNKGLIVVKTSDLKAICQQAYAKNYQVNTHAIGDSANRMMLHIYGEFLKSQNDKRWRIEHAQVIDPDDFELFKQFSVVPSVQPTHATSDMYWAGKRLGTERIKNAYAYKTLMEQNGWIANGSDFPVEDINPIYGFYASVARQDFKNFPEGGFQTENALSREEAIRAMTIWAAKSNFEENERGSIEVGKLADFVVTDKDFMKIDIHEVPKVKVEQTFIGGERVYLNTK